MADLDAAFLWETEALRSSGESAGLGQSGPAKPERSTTRVPDGWLTLRQASAATGIPVTTLRKWASKGHVPSVLDETATGGRRMVSLDGIRDRARRLGRVPDEPRVPMTTARDPASEAGSSRTGADPPPGTMIVPIDAWDKMLLQLGNLHEAGQQLAEARERAARAETEAMFLRERLAEIRGEGRSTSESEPVPDPVESAQRPKIPSFTTYLWRSAMAGLRRKR